jgi:hypothetical protein
MDEFGFPYKNSHEKIFGYIMSKKLNSYINADGIKVTVFASAKPRKLERTWVPFVKYSIYNLGHQAVLTGRYNIRATAENI